ncbi:MAG: hypothetical protein ABF449_12585, partial [Ethanoligenens sp.]
IIFGFSRLHYFFASEISGKAQEGKYDKQWCKKQSTGGYITTSEMEPTHDMQEYTDMSMRRLLGGSN